MYRATKAGRGWVTSSTHGSPALIEVHAIEGLPQILNLEQALVPTDQGIILLDTSVQLDEQTYATIEALFDDLYSGLDRESFTQSIEPVLVVDLPTFVDAAIQSTRNDLSQFTVDSRPSMQGFNESPEEIESGEFDKLGDPIRVLRDTFTSPVLRGTEIVFFNGLMQVDGVDYEIVVVPPGSGLSTDTITNPGLPTDTITAIKNLGITIRFTEAPAATDRINIYGVNAAAVLSTSVGIIVDAANGLGPGRE